MSRLKLYEIDNAILDCIDLETGEVLDAGKLDELQMERDEKVENVVLWVKDLAAEAEALKAEKMAFAERQRVVENKIASLKGWLEYALDGKRFETAKCRVTFRKSESVQVDDINGLMDFDDSLVTFSEPKPNKAKIKQALKDGIAVTGCQLVQSISTQIK